MFQLTLPINILPGWGRWVKPNNQDWGYVSPGGFYEPII
jgi:hypothetical protein